MPPKRPDLILPSHIPNIELDVLISDSLDVEADGRNRSNVGVELQLVEDCYRPVSVSLQMRRYPTVGPRAMETYWSFLRHLSPA